MTMQPDNEWREYFANVEPEGTCEVRIKRVTVDGLQEFELAVFEVVEPASGYGFFGVLEMAGRNEIARGINPDHALDELYRRITEEGIKTVQAYCQEQVRIYFRIEDEGDED